MAGRVDAMLVVGAPNSSNSQRLVEVGSNAGCGYSQLVQRAANIDWRALEGINSIGITAGASAPELLVQEVIDALGARYELDIEVLETAKENVEFKVPRVLRTPA
jgi:4-hydroxy-3-methylbut-2-enyl diphosphate reductase